MDLLAQYSKLVDFLALYLGADSEVSLCDREKVLYIQNAFSIDRVAGAPIGDMQQSFINNPEFRNAPSTVNYRALTKNGEKLRSATMFMYEGTKLVGLLTINTRVDNLLLCRQVIDNLIQGDHHTPADVPKSAKKGKSKDYYETLSLSVSDLIDDIIQRATEKFNAPAERFNVKEKQAVVRELDDRGVFLVKGSVAEISKRFNTSDATIYRYLQQMQR